MAPVDYRRADVAARYAAGRALPSAVLDRWRDAVVPWLPGRAPLRVLDLGAGTGIFTRAWPTWCDCEVVAVEPSEAMRAELRAEERTEQRAELRTAAATTGVRLVAASDPQLPLADGCVDVAWLSTVVHHLVDLSATATELRRILRPDGVVLLRGLFADLGEVAALDALPGAERALQRFPTVDAVAGAFAGAGFRPVHRALVEDYGPATAAEAAERVRSLRHADTLLGAFTDAEIDEGLAVLDGSDPNEPLPPSRLGLVALGTAT